MRKLSNEDVDKKLLQNNPSIIRKSNYIGSKVQTTFECLVCHYNWMVSPNMIINGYTGCPQCSNVVQLTNETFDKKLINKNIKRIDDYVNYSTKITFQCLDEDCGYIWKTTPRSILRDSGGCQKCSGRARLTNSDIDILLINRNIKRLDDFITTNTKIRFQCLYEGCKNIWEAAPAGIIYNYSGCPKCNPMFVDLALTTDIFIQRSNSIHENKYDYSITSYINSTTKIKIICPTNDHGIFEQMPPHHLKGHGCPKCGHSVSKCETAWLDSLKVPIEYRQNNFHIGNKLIKPDAYDPVSKTIYEFYGDFWHGNPNRFSANAINALTGTTFGELYKNTMDRIAFLKKEGYTIISIWESEWDLMKSA